MFLSPKTITVFIDASPSGTNRARQAALLAQRWDAHLIGSDAAFAGVVLPASMCWARGDAMRQVVDHQRQLDSTAEAAAYQLGERFRRLCADLKVSAEFRTIGREKGAEKAIHVAFHSDLVFVGHPHPDGLPDYLSVEKLLLESAAPVLIIPNDWDGETIGDRILIGWNATREARRAVADAMAFFVTAKSVTALVVDPDRIEQLNENGGSDFVECLDRHGAHVDLEQRASLGLPVSAVLLGYAKQIASDLLVIGAYSHARFREALLGGTTRSLLAKTPMPTLMSR
jgi:nucleotide-binding universal stress UspA family protein